MKPRNLVFVALLWMGLVLPPMTLAHSLTAKEILTTFNVAITGTFTSQADIEGRIVAGTIFEPNGSPGFYNKPSPIANNSTNFQEINAVNITCGSVTHCRANNGASVNWVNSQTGGGDFNSGSGRPSGMLVHNSPLFTMSQFTVPLNALEAHLSTLTANRTTTLSFGTLDFKVTPGPNRVAVFDIPVAELQSATGIMFTGFSSHDSIIINVTGTKGYSYSQGTGFFNPPTSCQATQQPCFNNEVIWNFQNAGTLHLFNWHGSVLAGMANITGTGAPLEGLLYAATYTGVSGGAEVHDFPYLGQIPQEEVEIPESSTWTMLILGLAGLVLVGRRRALCKSGALA